MILRTKQIAAILLFLVTGSGTVAQTAPATQAVQTEVSEDELTRFAGTFQQMRMMNQEVQVKMTQVISEEEMEIKRFNEIHMATLDPSVEVEVTEKEQEKYSEIVSEVEKIQLDFQEDMEEIIQESGLTVERYQEIATQLETDPELQQRLKDHFQQ